MKNKILLGVHLDASILLGKLHFAQVCFFCHSHFSVSSLNKGTLPFSTLHYSQISYLMKGCPIQACCGLATEALVDTLL